MSAWIVEAHGDEDRRWSEEACSSAGHGYTQFATRGEADAVRRSLVALGEGWTDENTRVRDTSVPMYEREAQS